MAREDLIPQLLRQLTLKEGPPEESDNTILQKMIVPLDKATLSDAMTVLRVPTSSQIWGSFNWSMSQWGSVSQSVISPQDKATFSDTVTLTKLSSGTQPWGYFKWSMNQWG